MKIEITSRPIPDTHDVLLVEYYEQYYFGEWADDDCLTYCHRPIMRNGSIKADCNSLKLNKKDVQAVDAANIVGQWQDAGIENGKPLLPEDDVSRHVLCEEVKRAVQHYADSWLNEKLVFISSSLNSLLN